MSWNFTTKAASKAELAGQLAVDVAACPYAPHDGRIARAAAVLLEGLPEASAGRMLYVNTSGHTEPAGSSGTSYIAVSAGETTA